MEFSDLAAVPVQLGAAMRGRPLFHPIGIVVAGTLTRVAPACTSLPLQSTEVIGRISKGIGTIGALPDFAGLAWRMSQSGDPRALWDVLMVTAAARVVPLPVTSWSDAVYSTIMPLHHQGESIWLRARMTSPDLGGGLSLDDLRRHIATEPIRFVIEQATGLRPFVELAVLSFDRQIDPGDQSRIAFDPTLHSHPEVQLSPRWLTGVRRWAYAASRRGRAAYEP